MRDGAHTHRHSGGLGVAVAIGAGVAFVRLEADPDPVRVRAGWVTDADIRDMADQCAADTAPLPELEGVAA